MQWDSNLQSKDSYTFILNIFSACTRRSIILMTILHNFTAASGQFSCPKCTRLACISRFYWHRVHNAPTFCRCAGKHFYGFHHFGATRSEFLKSFFGCQSFRRTLKDPVQTCQSGQKLVSPNVITFDVNIELQTDEMLWYVCKIKQKQQEKFKFITLNRITVEIRTWIRDFSWLFEINRLNKTKNSPIVEKKSLELTGAFFWISPQHKTKSDLSYGDNLHHDCTCIVVKLDNAKRGIPSQGAKVDLDIWPRDPKAIGFLLSSLRMCMWSSESRTDGRTSPYHNTSRLKTGV